jgi:hypothetical protein
MSAASQAVLSVEQVHDGQGLHTRHVMGCEPGCVVV